MAISRGIRVPLVGQVRFSSEYLWASRGELDKAVSNVWVFLCGIFGELITLQPAGIDLALDFAGLDVSVCNPKDHFIYRAITDDDVPGGFNEDGMIDGPDTIKRRWRRLTGLPFGRHTSAVSGLLYDKTHEIKYHSQEKTWFYDLWPVEKDEDGQPKEAVWRLELRFKRNSWNEKAL